MATVIRLSSSIGRSTGEVENPVGSGLRPLRDGGASPSPCLRQRSPEHSSLFRSFRTWKSSERIIPRVPATEGRRTLPVHVYVCRGELRGGRLFQREARGRDSFRVFHLLLGLY